MVRFAIFLLIVLFGCIGNAAAHEQVEARGLTPVIKLEETIYGHLNELNGKYKLRATEVTFAPGAFLGAHHHIGPGIRYVLSGELAFTAGGRTIVYRAGDYFFETGNLVHTAENRSSESLRVLFFEVLPHDWVAPTIIAPKS